MTFKDCVKLEVGQEMIVDGQMYDTWAQALRGYARITDKIYKFRSHGENQTRVERVK